MPVVAGTKAALSVLHLWELDNPRTSPLLRRSILPRGSCWHLPHRSGAGHLSQRAAPFTVPSGAQLPLCTKNQWCSERPYRVLGDTLGVAGKLVHPPGPATQASKRMPAPCA